MAIMKWGTPPGGNQHDRQAHVVGHGDGVSLAHAAFGSKVEGGGAQSLGPNIELATKYSTAPYRGPEQIADEQNEPPNPWGYRSSKREGRCMAQRRHVQGPCRRPLGPLLQRSRTDERRTRCLRLLAGPHRAGRVVDVQTHPGLRPQPPGGRRRGASRLAAEHLPAGRLRAHRGPRQPLAAQRVVLAGVQGARYLQRGPAAGRADPLDPVGDRPRQHPTSDVHHAGERRGPVHGHLDGGHRGPGVLVDVGTRTHPVAEPRSDGHLRLHRCAATASRCGTTRRRRSPTSTPACTRRWPTTRWVWPTRPRRTRSSKACTWLAGTVTPRR